MKSHRASVALQLEPEKLGPEKLEPEKLEPEKLEPEKPEPEQPAHVGARNTLLRKSKVGPNRDVADLEHNVELSLNLIRANRHGPSRPHS